MEIFLIALVFFALTQPLSAQTDETGEKTINPESGSTPVNESDTELSESESDNSEEVVKFVDVQLLFLDGDLRPELAEDLRSAIVEVCKMAIIDQLEGDIDYINENLDEITDTLKRVIDLTLSKRGFKVDRLEITPGETTLFALDISVSGGEIIDIEVQVLAPIGGNLADELLSKLKTDLVSALRRRFQGLPTSDINWLYKLFDDALKEEREKIGDFKWFDYEFELSPGPITRVILHLVPRAGSKTINKHFLRTRSSTLLNISLEDLREVILNEISCLDGMPVDFVRSHFNEIELYLSKRVEGLKTLRFYDAKAVIILEIKTSDLEISAIVESRKYRTNISGQVDFNKDEENPLIEGRIGVMGGEAIELYANVKFYPDNVDFEPELGFGLHPVPDIFLGGGWDFDRETPKLRGDVWFGTNILVSVEQYTDSEFNDDSKYSIAYFITRDLKVSATLDGAGTGFFSLGVVL